jgi:hypothetical protein
MSVTQPRGFLDLPLPRLPDGPDATIARINDYLVPVYDSLVMLNTRAASAVFYNVKDYGAQGDGVTDDRSAIILAYQDCVANGGGIIYFPAGIYIIPSKFPTITNTVGIVFMGAGMGAAILKSTVPAATPSYGDPVFFNFNSCTAPVIMTDLTLDVNNITTVETNTCAIGAAFCDAGMWFMRMEIKNGTRNGFVFGNCTSVRIQDSKLYRTYPTFPVVTITAVVTSGATANFRLTVTSVANLSNTQLVTIYDVGGLPTLWGTYQILNKNSGTNQIDVRRVEIGTVTNAVSSTGVPGGLIRITVADPTSVIQNNLGTAEGLTTTVAISYIYSIVQLGDTGKQWPFNIDLTGSTWGLIDSYGGGGLMRYSTQGAFVGGYVAGGSVRIANRMATQAVLSFNVFGLAPESFRIINNDIYGWGLLLSGANHHFIGNKVSQNDYGAGIAIANDGLSYGAKILDNDFIGTWGEDVNITVVEGVECWGDQCIIANNRMFSIAGGGISYGGQKTIIHDNIISDVGRYTRNSDAITLVKSGPSTDGLYSTIRDNVLQDSGAGYMGHGYAESDLAAPFGVTVAGNKITGNTLAAYKWSVLGAQYDFRGAGSDGFLFIVGGALAAGASFQFNVFVAGAVVGTHFAEVLRTTASTGDIWNAAVIAGNQVQVTVTNPTAAIIGVLNGTYQVRISERRQ